MGSAPFENENTIDATKPELLSLCARYPEITFDSSMEKATPKSSAEQVQSSPLSGTEKDEGETSRLSDSTAHTTPIRDNLNRSGRLFELETLPGFLDLVRSSRLDEDCSQIFVGLGCVIDTLAQAVLSRDDSSENQLHIRYVSSLCQSLLAPISEISSRVDNYIRNVSRLKSLVAFNTQPTDDFLWSSYRQRAQLIIRYAALPTMSENDIICALAQLYNSQVYKPFLDAVDEEEDQDTSNRFVIEHLNQLYDTIMTWQERYRTWCNHMKDLKYNYMLPLLKRIHASPQVLQEVKDLNVAKTAAKEILARPGAPGTLPANDSVVQALSLSARRRDTICRQAMNKARRGHTV